MAELKTEDRDGERMITRLILCVLMFLLLSVFSVCNRERVREKVKLEKPTAAVETGPAG